MPFDGYEDFVLAADHVALDDQGRLATFEVRVFASPVGEGEKLERVTVPDLAPALRRLEDRRLDADVAAQVELGAALGRLLLPEYARGLFAASLARIGDRRGLRLRLRLADGLEQLPWEYAYLESHHGEATADGFLALNPRVSIVRHEAIAAPVPDDREAPSARRVLVAMASPGPHDHYPKLAGLPREQQALKSALGEVPGVVADYLPDYAPPVVGGDVDGEVTGVTRDGLWSSLLENTDIFHFAGHGEFATDMGAAVGSVVGTGSLVLADAANRADPVPADLLGQLLAGKGVRLAVLGACETGRRDGENVWSSVVASLLRAGIPAVVAMQFTVGDEEAAQFSGALYRALVAGLTVDEAVALGRTAIRLLAGDDDADRRDWGVPVLYLRNEGSPVFKPVSDTKARKSAVKAARFLIRQDVRRVPIGGRLTGALVNSVTSRQIDVDMTVDRVEGDVIGVEGAEHAAGGVRVHQKADTVSGTVTGIVIGGPEEGSSDER